jgi:hypothetical protein
MARNSKLKLCSFSFQFIVLKGNSSYNFQETITSASSITQSLTSELLDGHRKLLALVTSGNASAQNTNVLQPNNGPITGPPEVPKPSDFP